MGGGVKGTIDPSCEPDPLPLAPGPPGRLSLTGGRDRKNRARYARFFFCRAVRGNDEDPGRQGVATNLPRKRRTR